MEKNCDYYLSVGTTREAWRQKNTAYENKLLACLYEKKQLFFSRVSYKNSKIQGELLVQLLEDAFGDALADFMKNGREGNVDIKGGDIPAYVFGMFKFKFFSVVRKENNFIQVKKEVGMLPSEEFDSGETESAKQAVAGRLQKTLAAMGETRCKDLLTWRYLHGLDYDEIVKRSGDEFNRQSAVKMTSRCKDSFRKIWEKIENE